MLAVMSPPARLTLTSASAGSPAARGTEYVARRIALALGITCHAEGTVHSMAAASVSAARSWEPLDAPIEGCVPVGMGLSMGLGGSFAGSGLGSTGWGGSGGGEVWRPRANAPATR